MLTTEMSGRASSPVLVGRDEQMAALDAAFDSVRQGGPTTVLLGGEAGDRPDEMFERWRHALTLPNIHGLVVGRNLLYPPDDDVAAAVDIAVSLL